jgi:hypothetical protein
MMAQSRYLDPGQPGDLENGLPFFGLDFLSVNGKCDHTALLVLCDWNVTAQAIPSAAVETAPTAAKSAFAD